MDNLVFVVPAYNEEANITQLLERTREAAERVGSHRYKIIVVDDGSTDETSAILQNHARHLPLEIVRHSGNLGVGRAFLHGFQKALELCQDSDVIVTMEADNTSDLGILPQLVGNAQNGSDLALASCYARGGRVEGSNWWRHLLSGAANAMLRVFCPIRGVRTYSSFYRAYRAGLLRRAMQRYGERLIEERGFACMLEVLMKLQALEPRITEVPMVLRCQMRKGQSKMKTFRTIVAYFRLMSCKGGWN